MSNNPHPNKNDLDRGFRFPRGKDDGAHEPTAAVRMNRNGWPATAIATTLHMDLTDVRTQLQEAPRAEREY